MAGVYESGGDLTERLERLRAHLEAKARPARKIVAVCHRPKGEPWCVALVGGGRMLVELDPAAARLLARQILQMAEVVDPQGCELATKETFDA